MVKSIVDFVLVCFNRANMQEIQLILTGGHL